MRLITLSALLLISSPVFSEAWECKEIVGTWDNILIEAKVVKKPGTGVITAAGKDNLSKYSIKGFTRRWDFGGTNSKGVFNYSFLLELNGDGSYYDFSSAKEGAYVSPLMTYQCRAVK